MIDLARVHAVALSGLEGTPVEVQTHIGPGLVGTTLVGLPDASLREAKERVRAALWSCGIAGLNKRVTVNLSPADLPKAGSAFDLAIAISILIARDRLPTQFAADTMFVGELGLDGSLQPVLGSLPMAMCARRCGFRRIVLPLQMVAEADLVDGLDVVGCQHLNEIIGVFGNRTNGLIDLQQGWEFLQAASAAKDTSALGVNANGSETSIANQLDVDGVDMADIRGQAAAIKALSIAAVGGHHALLFGPPGIGKTMLAARLGALLPDLGRKDSLELAAIRSITGAGTRGTTLAARPPVVAPHHSASLVSLIGGGNPIRPGSISLAHTGVLVLDEAPEFNSRSLDALRQPLEEGRIAIHRAHRRAVFPARFQMVMTANPCPCGGEIRAGDYTCRCSHSQKARYWSRLSGPLTDRIDLRLRLERPHPQAVATEVPVSTSDSRARVIEARARSDHRWKETPWTYNSEVPGSYLRQHHSRNTAERRALETATERGLISMRSADRILRLAWSVADWEGHSEPTADDLAKAFELRDPKETNL